MISELCRQNRVIGIKQTIRAVKQGRVERVFIAGDAEKEYISPVIEICKEKNIPYEFIETKEALGKGCGIAVGAAVAALLCN